MPKVSYKSVSYKKCNAQVPKVPKRPFKKYAKRTKMYMGGGGLFKAPTDISKANYVPSILK